MQAERLDDGDFVISCEMDSTPDDVSTTLTGINALLREEEYPLSPVSSWELVVAEVLNNIVEHAYQDQAGGLILLNLKFSTHGIKAQFTDYGLPMPGGTPPDGVPANLDVERDDLPEGGFGWFLIHSMTEDLVYRKAEDGNLLTLTVPMDDDPPA